MQKANKIRIVVYVGLLIFFIVVIQIKKNQVITERTRDVISIPAEIKTHGWPVDIEKMKNDKLYETARVTLESSAPNSKESYFLISPDERKLFKVGQDVLNIESGKVIGKIMSIASTPQLSTGLYKVSVSLEGAARVDGSIDVVSKVLTSAISIPIEAVDYNENKTFVWVNIDGKAKKKEVVLGVSSSQRIEVSSGLEQGELVVINGFKVLQPGYQLRVRKCISCGSKEVEK